MGHKAISPKKLAGSPRDQKVDLIETEDLFMQEDHSYLFNKHEKGSGLMCLITKEMEKVKEKGEDKKGFNIFEIAEGITKI